MENVLPECQKCNTGVLLPLSDYGREVGLAYQLADDLVDLEHGEIIDSVIIPLLNRLDQTKIKIIVRKKTKIKKCLAKNKNKIQEIYIEEIKKHIRNAEELGKSDLIPSSQYKNLLQDAPNFIINKMLKEVSISI